MNIRFFLAIAILVAVGITAYYLITQITTKTKQKAASEALVLKLPHSVKIEKLLKANTPSVFVAFHPECEHCQYEAKSINEKQEELQNINIIMFASASDSLTKAFSHSYGLDTIKNVHLIADEQNELYQQFGVTLIPTVFIYNTEGKLIKKYNGEVKIETIIKMVNLQSN